jgi:hypothetical protein
MTTPTRRLAPVLAAALASGALLASAPTAAAAPHIVSASCSFTKSGQHGSVACPPAFAEYVQYRVRLICLRGGTANQVLGRTVTRADINRHGGWQLGLISIAQCPTGSSVYRVDLTVGGQPIAGISAYEPNKALLVHVSLGRP